MKNRLDKWDINEYRHGNAVIYVYRPTLSEAERQKRINRIEIALARFGAEMERSKQK